MYIVIKAEEDYNNDNWLYTKLYVGSSLPDALMLSKIKEIDDEYYSSNNYDYHYDIDNNTYYYLLAAFETYGIGFTDKMTKVIKEARRELTIKDILK